VHLDELLTSAKQSLLDRLANPLLGSFAVAWCAWNYKFLVILFSSASVSQTFALVDTIAFPDKWSIFRRGLLLPLTSACVYVFLYPYPARFIYEFTLKRQREITQTKQRIADETPLTLEESRRLRVEFIERERADNEQVQRLTEEISRLNSALDLKSESTSPVRITFDEPLVKKLEPNQFQLLQLIEKLGSPVLESQLIGSSESSQVETEYEVGELVRKQLLLRRFDLSRREHTLEFTHDGRKELLAAKKGS
jgi:hypothetical protein